MSEPSSGSPATLTIVPEPETTTPSVTPTTSGDNDDGFIPEAVLREMSLPDLTALVLDNKIEAPIDAMGSQHDLVEWLLECYGA